MTPDEQALEILRAGKAGQSGWTRGKCPFCLSRTGKEDKRGAFGIHGDTGWYSCFKCGVKGRLKYNDAADRLGAPWLSQPAYAPPTMRMPDGFHPLFVEGARRSITLEPARHYILKTRRIPERIAIAARIGAVVDGPLANRVVVPIGDLFDVEGSTGPGNVLGWVARSYGPSSVPYLYPPGMARGEILYNSQAVLVETEHPLYVVEGVFDALAHFPNAAALLGKPSNAQVDTLSVAKRPVVVVLDGDAHEEGWSLSMRLRLAGVKSGSVRLPPRMDPDEVSQDALARAAVLALAKGVACL